MTGRRILVATTILALLLGGGLFGSVLAVGLVLSAPKQGQVGPPPSTLPDAEAVEFPSTSGAQLRGWWVPTAVPGQGVIVLMHGVRANRLVMARRAATLHEHGYAVLPFDLGAHGESTAPRITFGHREGQDAAASLAFVQARSPGERIGVIGVSLGGAAAVLAPEPLAVQAIVLESVFPDIVAALSNRLRVGLGPIIGPVATPVLTPAFMHVMPPVLGVTPTQLRPIDAIAALRAPALIMSGTADPYTPIKEARALFDAAPQPKQFWAVPEAAHVDLEQFDPDAYWRIVMPFLNANLR